ncbi:DgyrCDS3567 [Dimorphilus gyrociliatus]|uniref:DgyrCDS3567 n=1 Tax=Dimorphilus gyrociliatus TaxID=2664684 RepID=A0A7I8VE42_9ANNE|nr:DgyrCDS3567 [Dimorphilus gyrociliatus]
MEGVEADDLSQIEEVEKTQETPEKSISPEEHDDEVEKDCHDVVTDEGLGGNPPKELKQVTGRGVTLALLLRDKLIEPGEEVLSIEYLGKKFVADLLPDGKLKSQENVFNSPSAWAIHCKKVVNPDKKSGCGWGSVRYKGKKLDTYKTLWLKNKGLVVPTGNYKCPVEDFTFNVYNPKNIKAPTSDDTGEPIDHSALPIRTIPSNCYTLVQCSTVSSQPFSVSMNISSLVTMDLHSHASSSQVMGYLGGSWDASEQELSIIAAFPLFCCLEDTENSAKSEQYVRYFMEKRNLILVGWYHSHPRVSPCPTIFDIDCHMEYTYRVRGATYQPCIAAIFSPFRGTGTEGRSEFNLFWVAAPSENRTLEYAKPIKVEYSVKNDSLNDANVLLQIKLISAFYKEMKNGIRCPEDIEPEFELFTRNNRDQPEIISDEFLGENFDGKREKTFFVLHGFAGSGQDDWVIEMKNSLLDQYDCNFISVDWSWGALPDINRPIDPVPSSNARVVGRMIGNIIKFAGQQTELDFDSVHCIGYSLGGQGCGFFGKWMDTKIGRITGLDPAGQIFEMDDIRGRLDKTDANFVDVIHTNTFGSLISSGTKVISGHVDFIANKGEDQPGCDGLLVDVCSHERSHELWNDSLKNGCSPCSGDECQEFGMNSIDFPGRGVFSLITNDGASGSFCIPNLRRTEEMKWKNYTAVVPCVSVGNVSQLACDLIIHTLQMKKVGYLYSENVHPFVGNDPYKTITELEKKDAGGVTTAIDIYCSDCLAVIQFRTPVYPRRSKKLVQELEKFLKQFKEVLILSGGHASERNDKEINGPPYRLLTSQALEKKQKDLSWDYLERRRISGVGIGLMLFDKLEKAVNAAFLVFFCAEGDNADDGKMMANLLMEYLSFEKNKWKIPPSWTLQYGSNLQKSCFR